MNHSTDINTSPVTAADRERRDAAAGIQTTDRFTRFSQRNDMFNRRFLIHTERDPAPDVVVGSVRKILHCAMRLGRFQTNFPVVESRRVSGKVSMRLCNLLRRWHQSRSRSRVVTP